MVKRRIENGEDPLHILEECQRGMTLVGERFQNGDYFLSELLISTEIFKRLVGMLDVANAQPHEPRGKVVLATLRGDIHDLGKNVFAALLKAQGFEVHDLGVNVEPARLVETVKDVKPEFVGFSALVTSSFASMKEAAQMLEETGLRNGLKLMVGGGVTSPLVKEHIGADFQTADAMEGVAYCMNATGGN